MLETLITKEIEKQKNKIFSLVSELVAQNTVNPPGNEFRAAKIVERELKKYGIKYKKFEKTKGRPNIIAYIGKGKKSVFIPVHLDTVPAEEGWHTNPFKVSKKSGFLYGLGVSDNKGPAACLLIVAKILKKYEKKLKSQVIIGFFADEERGSENGLIFLLDKKIIKPDFAVVPDSPTNLKKISIGEKGRAEIKITSYGQQAHAARPEKGINAIYNMSELIKEIKKYKIKSEKDKFFTAPTINLGKIDGGTAPNSVPARCVIIIDIRYLPGQSSKKILQEMKTLVKRVEKKNKKAKFSVNLIGDMLPTKVPEKSLIVDALKKSMSQVIGKDPEIYASSGATVAKQMVLKNIQAVAFGPGDKIHCADEKISEKELVDFTKICTLVVFNIP